MHGHIEKYEDNNDFSSIIMLFRYGRGTYSGLAFAIGLIGLSSFAVMLSAKSMGALAEGLRLHTGTRELVSLVLFIMALEIFNVGIYYFGRVQLAKETNKVAYLLRQALFEKLAKLPVRYFDEQPLGRTITRLTADVEGIESFFSSTLPKVLNATMSASAVLIAMLVTDLQVGFVIVISSLPALVFTITMRRPVLKWVREYKIRSASINAKLAEYIAGIPIIKLFGLESWSESSFRSASKEQLKAAYMMMNWNSFVRPLAAFLCSLPIVVVLYWGGHLVIQGTLSLGLLVAFIRFSERYFRPIMQLSFELHLIQDAIASGERLKKLLEEPEESIQKAPEGTYRGILCGKIEFQQVSMGYNSTHKILKNVSFKVEKGQSIGLVGRSGSGKSTLLNLIPQLYPFQDGHILIDDIPINTWDRQTLRSQIGIVSQDVVIFHGTLRENLLITLHENNTLTDEEITAACIKTGLSMVIERLPRGLDTILLDSGTNLSMGERQLIAFTRMLLRNPRILILDEATANIDEKCESLIQHAIEELMRNRSCFIIAHRLSTIQHCDQILVLDQGAIIERGRHQDLLQAQGYYAKLVHRQLSHEFT